MSSLNLHAWLMLRNSGWGGGVGCNVILELAHIAGRSKKLEPLCWKPLESSWLKWLNCRNVVVVKLKTQEKNRN